MVILMISHTIIAGQKMLRASIGISFNPPLRLFGTKTVDSAPNPKRSSRFRKEFQEGKPTDTLRLLP
jgi:hypothetical protein